MSETAGGEAKFPFPIDFGLIIAFGIPGAVAANALRYVSPEINRVVEKLLGGELTAGPVIFLTLASLAAGLVVSASREVILERFLYNPLFGKTEYGRKLKIESVSPEFGKIKDSDSRSLFYDVVTNYYRYYQFYGNTFISVILFLVLRCWFLGVSVFLGRNELSIMFLFIGTLVVLFIASRNALKALNSAIGKINAGV
jgi:hypothetical protein